MAFVSNHNVKHATVHIDDITRVLILGLVRITLIYSPASMIKCPDKVL